MVDRPRQHLGQARWRYTPKSHVRWILDFWVTIVNLSMNVYIMVFALLRAKMTSGWDDFAPYLAFGSTLSLSGIPTGLETHFLGCKVTLVRGVPQATCAA
ncbi:hypothetical protein TNCV_5102091 [Trichonephila clavipes]|nr:hypothetical protein TNCV_5102091 [Trichonephila clavipes]